MKLGVSDLIIIHRCNVRAFLFDLDGTLVNSSKAIIDAITTVLDFRDYSYDSEKIAKMIGTPLEDMFRALVSGLSDKEVWRCVHEYRKHYSIHHLKGTKIHPNVFKILRKLKKRGFRLGLVTTKYRKFVLEILDHFNLVKLFDAVVTGYELRGHKPAPDIILEIAKRLGIEPSECAVVGDSPLDVEAGNRAGALTTAILIGPYNRQQMENAKPDLIVENLESFSL